MPSTLHLRLLAVSLALAAGGAGYAQQTSSPQIGAVHQEGDKLPLTPTREAKFDEKQATWASLDISPDGKTLVFELLGDIYRMPAAGGEAQCILCGLPFDSQPTFSPDSTHLAFISDRSGNENLWIADADGASPRPISATDDNAVFISPAWAPDGKSLYVSRFKPDINAFELFRYALDGTPPEQITQAKSTPTTPKQFRNNVLDAWPSADGKYLYYEQKTGLGFDDDIDLPLWHIVRRTLATGDEETIVTAQGSAFRPVPSPDGHYLAYATRYRGQTGLRLRDLTNDEDRPLVWPVQRDDQEASASRGLLPRYTFTPDSRSLVVNYAGGFHRIDIASAVDTTIPFVAHVDLAMGPYLRQQIPEDTGPVRARLIQTPSQSPDGTQLVFSALAHIYVNSVTSLVQPEPRRLTGSVLPEFDPAWSPDGEWISYVTYTRRGGDLWITRADGSGAPRKLSDHADLYRSPAFTPDGKSIVALRSSNYEHNLRGLEFSPFQSDAIEVSVTGSPARVLTSGVLGGPPQFTQKAGVVYLHFADGLYEVPLNGSPRHRILVANGPTWYFVDGLGPANGLAISPDGQWALAQITQQLYLLRLPRDVGDEKGLSIELAKPSPLETRITSVGADFFAWADGGKTITWAIGSTFYREPLASLQQGIVTAPEGRDDRRPGVSSFPVAVDLPRDTPHDTLVLRGATAITMRGNEVIPNADIVLTDDHITAIGAAGTVAVPSGAHVLDAHGKFITPGFTDVHLHYGDVRRGELDLESWGFRSSLAYGITSALDPSPLSIDMIAYQDLIDAGLVLGTRVFSTGPAVFSFNQFQSLEQTETTLSRYTQDYRIRNLKEYRTGNRRQREWVVMATQALGLETTCEGALDMKLDMTQIQDGLSGNEHAYATAPIFDDIVQLFVRSGVSYTPTLQIGNGGRGAQEFFYSTQSPADAINDDPKLRHFEPGFILDHKTAQTLFELPREYAFPLVAAGAAAIQRAGGLVAVGSHGEIAGLGFHLEMQALASGGMTPMEVLHAATIGGSKTIGRDGQFGSLEPGKFADLLVFDRNPLDDIHNTLSLSRVMKNGRLYDAATLDQLFPQKAVVPPSWFSDARYSGAAGEQDPALR